MPLKFSPETDRLIASLTVPRLSILLALWSCQGDVCGCDLTGQLQISKNLLSYHLKALREAGFIEEARCGQKKQYVIAAGRIDFLSTLFILLRINPKE